MHAEESCRHGVKLTLPRSYVCFQCHIWRGTATWTHLSPDEYIMSSRRWYMVFHNLIITLRGFCLFFCQIFVCYVPILPFWDRDICAFIRWNMQLIFIWLYKRSQLRDYHKSQKNLWDITQCCDCLKASGTSEVETNMFHIIRSHQPIGIRCRRFWSECEVSPWANIFEHLVLFWKVLEPLGNRDFPEELN